MGLVLRASSQSSEKKDEMTLHAENRWHLTTKTFLLPTENVIVLAAAFASEAWFDIFRFCSISDLGWVSQGHQRKHAPGHHYWVPKKRDDFHAVHVMIFGGVQFGIQFSCWIGVLRCQFGRGQTLESSGRFQPCLGRCLCLNLKVSMVWRRLKRDKLCKWYYAKKGQNRKGIKRMSWCIQVVFYVDVLFALGWSPFAQKGR